jgi:hypothetical protein
MRLFRQFHGEVRREDPLNSGAHLLAASVMKVLREGAFTSV